MNVLILQGSPRANGNTAWMAEEYRKAAEAAGPQGDARRRVSQEDRRVHGLRVLSRQGERSVRPEGRHAGINVKVVLL